MLLKVLAIFGVPRCDLTTSTSRLFEKFSFLSCRGQKIVDGRKRTPNATEPPTNNNVGAFGGATLGLDGPSGHYVGPHGCSNIWICTK